MIPKPVLMAAFGDVIGEQIWERARGLDGREVLLPSTPKSVSRETTIEGGTIDTEFLGGLLEYFSERIGRNAPRIWQAGAHTGRAFALRGPFLRAPDPAARAPHE